MQLRSVRFHKFRNYETFLWKPSSTLAVVTGPNGAGKTNLLEGLSFLAPGRGLRSASPGTLGLGGRPQWAVNVEIARGDDQFSLATGVESDAGKRIFRLDGQTLGNQAFAGELLSILWLVPKMERIFYDGAGARRRLLDRLVIARAADHAGQLLALEKALSSRNRILCTRPEETAWLDAIEDAIARHSTAVAVTRRLFVERSNKHPFQGPEFPAIRIDLECAIDRSLSTASGAETEEWIRNGLQKARNEDLQRRQTSIGAHKTDLLLFDAASGRPAAVSSSGEQKIMLLALVLAQWRQIRQISGFSPLILLDEPLTHLDHDRQKALLSALCEVEAPIIMTGTDYKEFSLLKDRAEFLQIHAGKATFS